MTYKIFPHEIRLSQSVNEFNDGKIDEIGLREAVENYIFAEARSDFDIMISNKGRRDIVYAEYADHVARTDFFAYALAKGKFSPEEIRRIPFDHGETPKRYIATYGTNLDQLVSREIVKLIHPEKTIEDFDDPHPVCSCEY